MFDPWIGKIPWRRQWLPTPLFLPGKFHGQSLQGYSPYGRKESGMTERTHTHRLKEHSKQQREPKDDMILSSDKL